MRDRDRVHILALIWGTYPRAEQLRLEAKYHFPASKWTTATAGLLLACAFIQIWATTFLHRNVYALVGPAYLVFESLYRLVVARTRHLPVASLAGYVLGVFLRPPQ